MNGSKLFGEKKGMHKFKSAARSAPAMKASSASASIVAPIWWTITIRC